MNKYTFHYKINSKILGYTAYLKITLESPLEPQQEVLSMTKILSQQTGIDAKEFIPVKKKEYRKNKENNVYIVDNN